MSNQNTDGIESLYEHEDDLRDLAASDLPCAWVAETLLAVIADADATPDDSRRPS